MTPTRFIPKDAAKIASKRSAAVVYVYVTANGKPAAIGYAGKSAKPAFWNSFRTTEHRANHVREWIIGQDKMAEAKVARVEQKKAMQAAGHGLKVGDVLYSSWGYEQTNIDFYEVVRLVGKASVAIRAIARESVETLSMQGKCVPVPGSYTGEEMVKRPTVTTHGVHVRITSYSNAYPAEKITSADGAFMGYKPHHWTAYA
jgi:hypothetical protein